MFDAVCGFEVARVISSPPARLLLIFLFLCKFIFRLAQSCGCRDRAAECDAATNRCIESAASAAAQMLFSIKTAANGGREGGRGERVRRGEGNWMGPHIYLLFVELIHPSFFSLALRTEGQRTETVHLLLSFLPLSSPPSFFFCLFHFIVLFSLPRPSLCISSSCFCSPLSPLSPYEYSTLRPTADRCGGFVRSCSTDSGIDAKRRERGARTRTHVYFLGG